MTAPDTATFAAFARLLGCKPSAVTALRHADRLVLTDDGKRVQVQPSLDRIAVTRDPSKAAVAARHAATRGAELGRGIATEVPEDANSDAADSDGDTPAARDYQGARARREHYQALEAQRAYEVAIGKLMDGAEVVSAVTAAIVELRSSLERLPDVLGPQLAAIHDEGQVRSMLVEAIEHALEETARQFAAFAKADAP